MILDTHAPKTATSRFGAGTTRLTEEVKEFTYTFDITNAPQIFWPHVQGIVRGLEKVNARAVEKGLAIQNEMLTFAHNVQRTLDFGEPVPLLPQSFYKVDPYLPLIRNPLKKLKEAQKLIQDTNESLREIEKKAEEKMAEEKKLLQDTKEAFVNDLSCLNETPLVTTPADKAAPRPKSEAFREELQKIAEEALRDLYKKAEEKMALSNEEQIKKAEVKGFTYKKVMELTDAELREEIDKLICERDVLKAGLFEASKRIFEDGDEEGLLSFNKHTAKFGERVSECQLWIEKLRAKRLKLAGFTDADNVEDTNKEQANDKQESTSEEPDF